MATIYLKRTSGNGRVTHGRLEFPQYRFVCDTLELREVADTTRCRISCAVPLGEYQLAPTFGGSMLYCPEFKRKPRGCATKPRFDTVNVSYNSLRSGDIALGRHYDDLSLRVDDPTLQELRELFRRLFTSGEDVSLVIYKTNRFQEGSLEFRGER